jgi:hypothetical protein
MPLKKTAKNPEVAKHMVVISDPSAAADIGSIIILVKIEFIFKLRPIYLIEVLIYLYFEGIEKTEYGYRNNYLLYSIAMENDNLLNENMPVEKKAVSQAKLDHLARMRARKQELKRDRQQSRDVPTQRKIRGKNKEPEAPPVNDLDESQSESEGEEPEPVQVRVRKAKPVGRSNKKMKPKKIRYEPSESSESSESESDDEPPRRRGKRESRRRVQQEEYEEEPQQQMSERDQHLEMLRSQMFGGGFY